MMTRKNLIPPGPVHKYDPSRDVLDWLMENLRAFGDIYRASMYGDYVYVVTNPQYVDHVLRENWQNYKKGQAIKRVGMLLGNGLMVSEGEFWKSQRRLIQPAFHAEAIEALVAMIQETSAALLTRWIALTREQRSINVTREVSAWVIDVVLRSIFGGDYDAVAPAFCVLSSESARDLQFAQIFRPLREVIRNLIAQRRRRDAAGTDMLGMLMAARDRVTGEIMPDGQLVSEIATLIVAGHETTASTLSWVWYFLSQYPDVECRLAAELSAVSGSSATDRMHGTPYLGQIIEETMRLYPPGWLLTRRALNDDYLGEYFVAAGTEIYISPYLIQRSPAQWKNPNAFDPDRFAPGEISGRHPMAHLPFSAGPRKCIGDILARMEMQIHVMTVVPHLRLHWSSGDPNELEAGVNLRCRNDFHFTGGLKSSQFSNRGAANQTECRPPQNASLCPAQTSR
jgi:cytochrome P450